MGARGARMGAAQGSWKQRSCVSRHAEEAKLGDPSAQNVLGFLYWEGTGIQKNQAEALYWWTLSAKQKNETAVENLRMAKRRLGDDFDTLRNAALRAKEPSQTPESTRP